MYAAAAYPAIVSVFGSTARNQARAALAAASKTDRVKVITNRLCRCSLVARLNNTSRGLRILTGAIERYTSLRLECRYRVLELVDWIEIFLAPAGRISNCLREQWGMSSGKRWRGRRTWSWAR